MDGNSCQMAFPSSSALAHDWIASLVLPTGARPRVHDTKNISTHEQMPDCLHLTFLPSHSTANTLSSPPHHHSLTPPPTMS